MSEPTITIPLSLLSNAKDLTAQGIIDALTVNQELVQENEGLKARVTALQNHFKAATTHLDHILDQDMNQMQKAQALRTFSAELKGSIQ